MDMDIPRDALATSTKSRRKTHLRWTTTFIVTPQMQADTVIVVSVPRQHSFATRMSFERTSAQEDRKGRSSHSSETYPCASSGWFASPDLRLCCSVHPG